MSAESATVTVTRSVALAAGVFAPGHLGELTTYLPFELVDDVLTETGTVQRRLRDLPSRVGVYFVLALGLFPRLGYARVWDKGCEACPDVAHKGRHHRAGERWELHRVESDASGRPGETRTRLASSDRAVRQQPYRG